MIRVAETKTHRVGKYVVRQQPHFDNPAFAQYLVFLGDVLIGKCFSIPCESDCEWLERQQREQTLYAYSSAPLKDVSAHRRGKFHIHRDRARKVRRPRLAKAA